MYVCALTGPTEGQCVSLLQQRCSVAYELCKSRRRFVFVYACLSLACLLERVAAGCGHMVLS